MSYAITSLLEKNQLYHAGPPTTRIESGVRSMFVPHYNWTLLSQEDIIPPRVLVTIGVYNKKTRFRGFLGNLLETSSPTICIRVGGPGLPLTLPLLGCLCDPPYEEEPRQCWSCRFCPCDKEIKHESPDVASLEVHLLVAQFLKTTISREKHINDIPISPALKVSSCAWTCLTMKSFSPWKFLSVLWTTMTGRDLETGRRARAVSVGVPARISLIRCTMSTNSGSLYSNLWPNVREQMTLDTALLRKSVGFTPFAFCICHRASESMLASSVILCSTLLFPIPKLRRADRLNLRRVCQVSPWLNVMPPKDDYIMIE